jgi:hypothetical protein
LVGATTTAVEIGLDGNYVTLDSPVLAVTVGSSASATLGQFVASTGYANPDGIAVNQSAFVVRGYRQLNGALAWEQTTAGNQPRLVNAGALDTDGGLAALVFSGSQQQNYGLISGASKPANYSVLSVLRVVAPTANNGLFGSGTGPDNSWAAVALDSGFPNSAVNYYGNNLSQWFIGRTTNPVVTVSRSLIELHKTSGVAKIDFRINGGGVEPLTDLLNNTDTVSGPTIDFLFGRYTATGYNLTGSMQCLLVYDENKTADRAGMKSSLNTMLGTSW